MKKFALILLSLSLINNISYSQTLEEIVVTATKRETNLQDTPIAMSVESAKSLEDRHVQSLLDLGDGSIPGLNIATFEARQSALTIGIRGIVPLDANQPAREQGVGVYIDGIYLGRQHGLNAALLDLERIEVLKGPQGTLFGRNTSGGAVSMVTRRPSGEYEGRVKSGKGNFGSDSLEAHIDLPEFANISTKIDYISQYQDATTKNPLEGEMGWNYYDRTGVRFSATWQGQFTTVDFNWDTGTDKNTPFYSQLLNYNPLGNLTTPLNSLIVVNGTDRMKVADIGVPQAPSIGDTGGKNINITWDVSDNLAIKSFTAQRFVDSTQWDNSGGAHRVPVAKPNAIFSRYSLSELHQIQVSQEFQIIGSTDTIDYVGGIYYFNEDANEKAATPSTNRWNATTTGYTINDPSTWAVENWFIDRGSKANSKSTAVFGQATYTPIRFDRLHITLGGRVTNDKKTGMLFKVKNLDADWQMNLDTTRFNPLAIAAFDVSQKVNVYAKYATGYRAGGASSRSLSFNEFGPEDNISYEFGVKAQTDRARINMSLYTMDRTGSQIDFSQVVYDPITKTTRNTLETLNAPGTTEIKGFEIDAQYAISNSLQVRAAYTFTDTHVPETINPFKNITQEVFIVFTPKNVYNIGIDHTTYRDGYTINAHVDANHQDATQAFSEFKTLNDSSNIMNASITVEDILISSGSIALQFWIRNLTDEAYVYRRDPSNDKVLGTYGNFNAPRTYGVNVKYEF